MNQSGMPPSGARSSAPDPWVGSVVGGRWKILSLLDDSGGMASVYLADDTRLPRKAVVKIPKAAQLNAEFAKRFAREAYHHATVDNLHVVHILDRGEERGVPFLVLQYLPGGNLRAWCDRNPSMLDDPQLHFESWLLPVAQALDAVAAKGIAHRDVKPTNILFDAAGKGYLSDFGIVKAEGDATMTGEGLYIGTLRFMSPEQCRQEGRETLDGRSDQYGLAMTIYQVLTGWKNPTVDDTGVIYAAKFGYERMKEPREHDGRIPRAVNDTVMRALAVRRDDRFATNVELARAVLAGFENRPTSDPRPQQGGHEERRRVGDGEQRRDGHVPQPPRSRGRSRAIAIAVGVGSVLALGGLLVRVMALRSTEPPGAPDAPPQVDIRPTPAGPVTPLDSQAGRIVRNSIGMELVRIRAGRFVMGSPEGEAPQHDPQGRFRARESDEPQVDVTISHPFLMGAREVTETQWEAVMGDEPWNRPPPTPADASAPAAAAPRRADATRAVTMPTVPDATSSWREAREFCAKLTVRERERGVISADEEYRLPTEAEWEYACRAGRSGPYWFGDTTDWSRQSRAANPWGLHGMHLDPWEWCDDEFRAVDDIAGSFPPLRGGEGSRAAERSVCVGCETEAGFRVVVARRPGVQGTVAGEERRDNGLSMPLVWVPSGAFRMRTYDLVFGALVPPAPGTPEARPWTDVAVGHGFWIGKYEVTLAEWFEVMEPGGTGACSATNGAGDVSLTVRLPEALDRTGEARPGGDPVEVSIDTGPNATVQGSPRQEVTFVGFTDLFDASRVPPAPPLVSGTLPLDPLTKTTTSSTNDEGLIWLTYRGRSTWKGRLGEDGRCLFGFVTLFVSGTDSSTWIDLPVAVGKVSANGRSRHPVFNATYRDARTFCTRLTARERRAGRLPAGWEYRLPTEVEWERAARAGAETVFAFGDDWDESLGAVRARYGWLPSVSDVAPQPELLPQPVGLKTGNAWRIFDAYGNAAEWCLRSAAAIHVKDAPQRGDGWLRGGSWRSSSPAVVGAPGALGGLRVVLAPIGSE